MSDEQMRLLPLGKVKLSNRWLMGLIVTGLLGSATAAYLLLRGNAPQADTKQTVMVQLQDLTVQIKANGVVAAVRKINLSPKDAGRIFRLYVDEGDKVAPSELIAQMDSEQFQAQVNQYQAALTKAQADLTQKQRGNRPEEIAKAEAEVTKNGALVVEARSRITLAKERVKRKRFATQQGAISRDELDEALTEERNARDNLKQAEASLAVANQELTLQRDGYRPEEIAQAKAEVAQATAQLNYYQSILENAAIRAPFAGIITRKFASEGDFVTPTTSASSTDGATSASIAELSSGLEVEAKIPEASIARIKPGQTVEIRSDAYPEQNFSGRVRLIAPGAIKEDNVTSFRVKVTLPTNQNQLKSGMNVKLTFLGDKVQGALVVPLAAIVTKNDGQTGVLVLDQNRQAQFRPVSIGSTSGTKVQILTGVSQGDRILISPPPGQVIPGVDTIGF